VLPWGDCNVTRRGDVFGLDGTDVCWQRTTKRVELLL
jgi:hypothetical protein